MKDIEEFEDRIGYAFHNKRLLENALTHSSFANERHWTYNRNNERLEFLGDAVLELVSSDFIFHEHSGDMEGGKRRGCHRRQGEGFHPVGCL